MTDPKRGEKCGKVRNHDHVHATAYFGGQENVLCIVDPCVECGEPKTSAVHIKSWPGYHEHVQPPPFQPEPSEPKRLYVIEHEAGCPVWIEVEAYRRSGRAEIEARWCRQRGCRIAVYRREEKP